MAREVLSNGVIVPEKYTRDWFDDFRTNLVKLNDAITAIAGKQNALTQEQLDAVNSAITSQKVTAYDDHIADTSKHLTDGTASKAIADEDGTSIKSGYVNVAGNQTVSGDKSFTGSNTFNSILPNATNTYSLGSSSYQWSSVYAQSYYYNGTAWGLDKSNTWTGINTFSSILNQNINSIYSEIPSSDHFAVKGITDNNGDNVFAISFADRSSGQRDLTLRVYNTDGTQQGVGLYKNNDNSYDYKPMLNGVINLGTSTNKWKTLNGINPGALSLPDASNAVSLDTTNVSMDGTYTYLSVSVNGWLYVTLKDTAIKTDGELTFYIGDSGTQSAYAKWAVNFVCSTDGYVRCFIPVLANNRIRIRINPNGGSPTGLSMTIYPCLGNV